MARAPAMPSSRSGTRWIPPHSTTRTSGTGTTGCGVPSLNIGGWYDIFLSATISDFVALRQRGVPAKLLIRPWAHGPAGTANPIGEVNFGFGAQAALVELRSDLGAIQLRWFDQWLEGIPDGVDEEPPVKIFVMGVNRWGEDGLLLASVLLVERPLEAGEYLEHLLVGER